MKSVKKLSLYIIIVFTAIVHNNSCAMPEWIAKCIPRYNPAGVAAVKTVDEVVNRHMPDIKKIADTLSTSGPEISKVALSDASKELSKGLVEASSKFGSEAAAILAPSLEIAAKAAGVGVAVYTTYKVVGTVNDIYNYCNPDQEKQARIDAAAEAVDILKAKRAFRTCLMGNPRTPRNDEGLPTICESFSNTYRLVAGQDALDEMTTNFKNAYKV